MTHTTTKTMTTARTTRYFWEYRQGEETTYALIDRVSAHEIATVSYLSTIRKWKWTRRTCALLHGAEPAEGLTKLLADAKSAVETGLPLEM